MIRQAPRPARLVLAGFVLVSGCGGAAEPPAPVSSPSSDPARATAEPDSALPATRPESLEIELRRRTAEGDDEVLKLTPAGARYGLARGKARVALSYRLTDADLDEVYATLRQEGFDRIETTPQPDAPVDGTSLRVVAGPGRYSASSMGRQAPTPEHAQAYARCVAAVESLLPQGRSEVVVPLVFDASMAEHGAALDLDVGEDLVGLHRVSAPQDPPQWALHLRRPRALQVQLRHGNPARASTLTVPAEGGGVVVTYDGAQDTVAARPGPAAAATPKP